MKYIQPLTQIINVAAQTIICVSGINTNNGLNMGTGGSNPTTNALAPSRCAGGIYI